MLQPLYLGPECGNYFLPVYQPHANDRILRDIFQTLTYCIAAALACLFTLVVDFIESETLSHPNIMSSSRGRGGKFKVRRGGQSNAALS